MENCDLLITHTTALLPDMTLRNDVAIAVDRGSILALDDNPYLKRVIIRAHASMAQARLPCRD